MSEEHGTYEARKPERRELDGVQRIGDVIRQIVDERDWPLRNSQPRANGDRRAGAGGGAPRIMSDLRAASRVARQADGSCPHCAGEQARFYRPGAPEDRPEITSPEAAAELLVPMLEGLDREHCITLNLDTKHRLIATTTVSIGSIDHTFMSPREIFRDALLHGASALVVSHNHPSEDAEPSRDDELVTRRLGQAGDLVGVDVLDHIVIGHQRWVSLARLGALMESRHNRWDPVTTGRARGGDEGKLEPAARS